jgi:hypothetical protein
LQIYGVPDARLITERFSDGERRLEAVKGCVEIGIHLVRAPDPAQQRGRARPFRRMREAVQGAFVEGARLLAPPLSLGELRLVDESIDGRRLAAGYTS